MSKEADQPHLSGPEQGQREPGREQATACGWHQTARTPAAASHEMGPSPEHAAESRYEVSAVAPADLRSISHLLYSLMFSMPSAPRILELHLRLGTLGAYGSGEDEENRLPGRAYVQSYAESVGINPALLIQCTNLAAIEISTAILNSSNTNDPRRTLTSQELEAAERISRFGLQSAVADHHELMYHALGIIREDDFHLHYDFSAEPIDEPIGPDLY